ncbi:Unknown protein, partial [Striga hermonthica]
LASPAFHPPSLATGKVARSSPSPCLYGLPLHHSLTHLSSAPLPSWSAQMQREKC